MSPTTPNGLPFLDNALATMQQLNGVLAGVPGMIALGVSLVQLFRDLGMSDEEVAAEVTKFKEVVDAAQSFNNDWLATHPRETSNPVPPPPGDINIPNP